MLLALIVVFIVNLTRFYHLDTRCQNGTSTSWMREQTRSSIYSLLANVSQPPCSEPFVQLSLFTRGSSVEVRQEFCKDMPMKQFTVEGSLENISIANHPYPVFDDVKNYSESGLPKNYFINGSIEVTMINTTTNSSSATVEVCLFTDSYDYLKFVDAGTNWNANTKNAECRSLSISNGGDNEASLIHNISEPAFAFVGIASPHFINISTLYVNATGYDISDFGTNSSRVCHLSDEKKNCYFQLLNTDTNKHNICIVAFEEEIANSYDYSNLVINLPTQSKSYEKYQHLELIYGVSSLAIFILALVLTGAMVYCLYISCAGYRNRSAPIGSPRAHTPVQETGTESLTLTQPQYMYSSTVADLSRGSDSASEPIFPHGVSATMSQSDT